VLSTGLNQKGVKEPCLYQASWHLLALIIFFSHATASALLPWAWQIIIADGE
jgi:hypothetical protein